MNGDKMKGPIVGVVRDFHDRSFRNDISAVCITTHSENYRSYAVKINAANGKTTLAALEKTWTQMHPDQLFEYEFVDDQIASFYTTEVLMLKLIWVFATIAIFIGCLGLYGLVSYMAAQKNKEIGIRKVLGSSIGQILWIFTREFSALILIAFLLAAPLAYYVMSKWLENFEFHVGVGGDVFAAAMLITFLIALLTVSYRSAKAALMNPAKSLRSE
jgi:ABC-type antimicrobial peptide transport system permease subunit